MENESIIQDETVYLDGERAVGCEFRRCTLVYFGGKLPELRYSGFIDCEWRFEGAAQRTLQLMRGIYHQDGGAAIIEKTFDVIRSEGPPGD